MFLSRVLSKSDTRDWLECDSDAPLAAQPGILEFRIFVEHRVVPPRSDEAAYPSFSSSSTTHGSRIVWPAHGPFQIDSLLRRPPHRIPRAVPGSTPESRILAEILLLRTAAVQRIEHVAIGAGPALRITGIQHVAHIQSTSLRATGSGGWRRRQAPWLRSTACLDGRATRLN